MSKLSEFNTPWGNDPATVLLRRRVDARAVAYVAEVKRGADDAGERFQRDLVHIAREAIELPADRNALAAYLGFMLMVACVQGTAVQRLAEAFNAMVPAANMGAEFMRGRKKEALSPVAKWVKAHMKRNLKATAATVWHAFKSKPAKGFVAFDNAKFGRYIEDEHGKPVMAWRRFQNLVSQHRSKLS